MRPLIDAAPVVMISASWPAYRDGRREFLEVFFETVQQLVERGKYVVLIGKAPVILTYDRRCPEKALTLSVSPLPSCRGTPVAGGPVGQ